MPAQYLVVNCSQVRPLADEVSSIPMNFRPTQVFLSERAAIEAAQGMARDKPRHQIAIFKSVKTIETKEPTFMEKIYTENGELIPASKVQA